MRMMIATTKTYVPRFNGNLDLPAAEQVEVTYKIPDIQLKQRLKPKPKFKFNYDAVGNTVGGETEVALDKMAVVSGMLVSIRNLEWEAGRGVNQVKNYQDLLKAPAEYEPLIDELYEEFSRELDRGVDEKN